MFKNPYATGFAVVLIVMIFSFFSFFNVYSAMLFCFLYSVFLAWQIKEKIKFCMNPLVDDPMKTLGDQMPSIFLYSTGWIVLPLLQLTLLLLFTKIYDGVLENTNFIYIFEVFKLKFFTPNLVEEFNITSQQEKVLLFLALFIFVLSVSVSILTLIMVLVGVKSGRDAQGIDPQNTLRYLTNTLSGLGVFWLLSFHAHIKYLGQWDQGFNQMKLLIDVAVIPSHTSVSAALFIYMWFLLMRGTGKTLERKY